MSRHGLVGSLYRSPLNPVWSAAQGPRMAGNLMGAMMPAVSRLGDQLVDQATPFLGQMAGDAAGKLVSELKNGNMLPGGAAEWLHEHQKDLTGLASSAAPMAAKMVGRGLWGGAAAGLGAAGDMASLDNPMMSLSNVMGGTLASMPVDMGKPRPSVQKPQLAAPDDGGQEFGRAPEMYHAAIPAAPAVGVPQQHRARPSASLPHPAAGPPAQSPMTPPLGAGNFFHPGIVQGMGNVDPRMLRLIRQNLDITDAAENPPYAPMGRFPAMTR